MASATLIHISTTNIMDEAVNWAARFKQALTLLNEGPDYQDFCVEFIDDDDLFTLPLGQIRLDESLELAPRRKSSKESYAKADAIAKLLYPAPEGSLGPLIRYERDRVRIRTWIQIQRRHDILTATIQQRNWPDRIRKQGQWNPEMHPISLDGPPSLPMPVKVSDAESLKPFFQYLKVGGTSQLPPDNIDFCAAEIEEPYYKTQAVEFTKGVLYEDGRMDLCKMVVGPPNIGPLLESLKSNEFVKHFLLGNNIIGPVGAKHIATFLNEYPEKIDTWYLAGNCIDGESFSFLVDAFVTSPAVTNIWLKRNPLGPNAAKDLFRLITQTPNLRTLDLDQTEVGDAGVAELFSLLAQHKSKTCLQNIYLNGNGISSKAASAIGNYLASPYCTITSLYMSNNPLGSPGASSLAVGLSKNRSLSRLSLQSTGLSDSGAIVLLSSLQDHPTLTLLDLGQSFATQDLGQAYNYLTDNSANTIAAFISSSPKLSYLNFGPSALTNHGMNIVLEEAIESRTLLYIGLKSIHPKSKDANSVCLSQEHARLQKLYQERVFENVRFKYGGMDYEEWDRGEKRWVISDRVDVRKIDSVYRNRDMGLARRGLKKLDKWWEEGDETLVEIMGPVCGMRKRGGV